MDATAVLDAASPPDVPFVPAAFAVLVVIAPELLPAAGDPFVVRAEPAEPDSGSGGTSAVGASFLRMARKPTYAMGGTTTKIASSTSNRLRDRL